MCEIEFLKRWRTEMTIAEIHNEELKNWVLAHPLAVLEFSASWCAPCQRLEKHMLTLSTKYQDVAFGRVNVEEEEKLAQEFEIRSVPAVMIIRDGIIVYAETGALTEEGL